MKRFYSRVQKGQFTRGIAKNQRREWVLNRMRQVAPTTIEDLSRKRKYGAERRPLSSEPPNPRVPFHNDEPLPSSFPDRHHEMSSDTRHKLDLPTWLGDLSDDPALEVRRRGELISKTLMRCLRNFSHASRIIFLGVCLDAISTAMSIASQQRNEVISFLQIIEFTNTRYFESTIQHMIFAAHKTLSTHGLMPIS